MVRGPMIAEVTAGWRMTNATAIWMRVSPASSGERGEGISGVELGGIGGVIGPRETALPGNRTRPADLPALAVPAGQPASGQRAIGHDAHSVAQAGRQQVVLDGAGQD